MCCGPELVLLDYAPHLLSLNEPRALGLVLVVSWSIGEKTRGSRQPEQTNKEREEIVTVTHEGAAECGDTASMS